MRKWWTLSIVQFRSSYSWMFDSLCMLTDLRQLQISCRWHKETCFARGVVRECYSLTAQWREIHSWHPNKTQINGWSKSIANLWGMSRESELIGYLYQRVSTGTISQITFCFGFYLLFYDYLNCDIKPSIISWKCLHWYSKESLISLQKVLLHILFSVFFK